MNPGDTDVEAELEIRDASGTAIDCGAGCSVTIEAGAAARWDLAVMADLPATIEGSAIVRGNGPLLATVAEVPESGAPDAVMYHGHAIPSGGEPLERAIAMGFVPFAAKSQSGQPPTGTATSTPDGVTPTATPTVTSTLATAPPPDGTSTATPTRPSSGTLTPSATSPGPAPTGSQPATATGETTATQLATMPASPPSEDHEIYLPLARKDTGASTAQ